MKKNIRFYTLSILLMSGTGDLLWSQETSDSIHHELLLDQVVVTTQVPRTKMKGSALETRVVGSVLEHAGTAEDVLSQIPGMVKQGDDLQVIGRGTPVYYVNGRRLQDADELKRLSSEQIKSVEVINNPGAAYDASVNAVVRIKTVRLLGEGLGIDFKSDLHQTLTHGDFDPGANIDLNYRHKGVDIFGGSDYWSNHYDEWDRIGGGLYSKDLIHEQQGSIEAHRNSRGLQYKLGSNWQINDNHSVGAMVQFYHNPYTKGTTVLKEAVFIDGLFEDDLTSTDHFSVQTHQGVMANTYYNGKLRDWSIDWNLDWVNQEHCEVSDIDEQSQLANNVLETESYRRNDMLATKLVLSRGWGKGTFKIGTEDIYLYSQHHYSTQSDFVRSSKSEVKETTLAFFTEYTLQTSWGRWVAGLRGEHVLLRYFNLLEQDKNLDRTYDELFPFLSWSHLLGKLGLSIDYSSRTRRPNYWQMRDVVEYRSRYVYEAGNPKLRNTVNHVLSAKAYYKWLSAGTEYLHAAHKILDWGESHDVPGAIMLKYRNLTRPVRSLSLYAIANPTLGCWSPNYTTGFTRQYLDLNLPDDRETNGYRPKSFGRTMYIFYANNAFCFNAKHGGPWQVDLNLQYRSPTDYDNTDLRREIWSLDAAIQKSFLDDNLTLRLSANDLLRHKQEDTFTDYGNYQVYQYRDIQSQSITFSLHYRFNSSRSKYRGSGAGEDVKSRM